MELEKLYNPGAMHDDSDRVVARRMTLVSAAAVAAQLCWQHTQGAASTAGLVALTVLALPVLAHIRVFADRVIPI